MGMVLDQPALVKLLEGEFSDRQAIACFQAFILLNNYSLSLPQLSLALTDWPEAAIFNQLSSQEAEAAIAELPRFETLLSDIDLGNKLADEMENRLENAVPDLNPERDPYFDLPYRLVLIAGPPRCGSMWTNNIARDLAQASGHAPLPKQVLVGTRETVVKITKQALERPERGTLTVIKSHSPTAKVPMAKFILPKRDIRDSIMSFMRFMNTGLDDAIQKMSAGYDKLDTYKSIPDEKKLILPFSTIVHDSADAIARIAMFLGFNVAEQARSEIEAKYSKKNVKQLIDKIDKLKESGADPDAIMLIGPPGEGQRAYDNKTGFQTGHVSNYRDGDWQTILTPEEQQNLNEKVAKYLDD